MNVLGIETSCDETAVAIVTCGRKIQSSFISSQLALHEPYGGVVPELASRHHLEHLPGLIQSALSEANMDWSSIHGLGVTYGPGLASSLLIGLTTAKAISVARGIPLAGINHMEAHLYSPFLSFEGNFQPHVALIVSGGHTMLLHAKEIGEYKLLGQTLDDAAGEAFDKVAKLLGLGYPGGPLIEKLAMNGNPNAHRFPRAMSGEDNFKFSFSGLKTSVLYFLKNHGRPLNASEVGDVCASFQKAVVDVLVEKTESAIRLCGVKMCALSGGVSCNGALRNAMKEACGKMGVEMLVAEKQFCTDNAAMIAGLAYHKLLEGAPPIHTLDAVPNLPLARE